MTAMAGSETSDEIEREAEISRARLALTLDQLRDNLTPRHLADEMLGHAREGASAVLDTLGASTAKHPVPALLISAACAALFSLATGPARQGHRGDAPAPIPYAPSEPACAPARAPAPSARPSRWAIFGERPLATAVLGVALGRWVAAALPRG
jgi:uncharacterized protein DUF3618